MCSLFPRLTYGHHFVLPGNKMAAGSGSENETKMCDAAIVGKKAKM